jgi:hypothetical protein
MIGSTLIYETNKKRLRKIEEDIDALDDFTHVELVTLTTVDFEEICCAAEGVEWAAGEPVVFNDDGLAIFPISQSGIEYVLTHGDALTAERQADIELIRAFVSEHGKQHIYELATF